MIAEEKKKRAINTVRGKERLIYKSNYIIMFLKLFLVLLIILVVKDKATSKSVEGNSASSETSESKSDENVKIEEAKSMETTEKDKIQEITAKPLMVDGVS